MSTKKMIGLVLVTFVLVYTGMNIPKYFSYSFTNSLSSNLFLFKKGMPEDLKPGEYVIFPIKIRGDLVKNCNPCKITKIVACIPGQTLKTEGDKFFCDGKYLGCAKKQSMRGMPVEQFVYNGKIPENKFFATGESQDSYDSKYYGLVEKQKIVGTAIPIF